MPDLADFGAEAPPPITQLERADDGAERCPVCEESDMSFVDTAVVDIPVSRINAEHIAATMKDHGVTEVRSRGDACPVCGALMPKTVSGPQAHGWEGHVGARVECADGTEIWVPVRLEDFPEPLHRYINHVREGKA
jgi:hypothetical protein